MDSNSVLEVAIKSSILIKPQLSLSLSLSFFPFYGHPGQWPHSVVIHLLIWRRTHKERVNWHGLSDLLDYKSFSVSGFTVVVVFSLWSFSAFIYRLHFENITWSSRPSLLIFVWFCESKRRHPFKSISWFCRLILLERKCIYISKWLFPPSLICPAQKLNFQVLAKP